MVVRCVVLRTLFFGPIDSHECRIFIHYVDRNQVFIFFNCKDYCAVHASCIFGARLRLPPHIFAILSDCHGISNNQLYKLNLFVVLVLKAKMCPVISEQFCVFCNLSRGHHGDQVQAWHQIAIPAIAVLGLKMMIDQIPTRVRMGALAVGIDRPVRCEGKHAGPG